MTRANVFLILLFMLSGCSIRRTLCMDLEPFTCEELKEDLRKAEAMQPIYVPPRYYNPCQDTGCPDK